jgi:hypothetical protein
MVIKILHDGVSLDALGLLPHFFDRALYIEGQPIQSVADNMDDIYYYGGFKYPFEGSIDHYGVYQPGNDEDEPLEPIAKITKMGYTLFIYPYAITGLVDSKGNQKIGRFD